MGTAAGAGGAFTAISAARANPVHTAIRSAHTDILGPSIASLDEIIDTAAYLGDAKYFMVKNFINNTYFFEWDEATTAAYFKRVPGAVGITISKLVELVLKELVV